MEWRVAEPAEQEFDDIFESITEARGIGYAMDFLEDFWARMDRIVENPKIYQVRADYYPGARKALLGKYAIFFSIQGDVVQVDHIRHQRSNPKLH